MENYPDRWLPNLDAAIKGGRKLGVEPVMEARDVASPNVEYLGVMAWAAQFQWIQGQTAPSEALEVSCPATKVRIGEECSFQVDVLERDGLDQRAISAEVIGPSGPVYADFELTPTGGQGRFLAEEVGMHEVLVKNEGEAVRGAPHFLRSMPKSKKDYEGIEPCAVGSTVEVLINPHHAARPELLEVSVCDHHTALPGFRAK